MAQQLSERNLAIVNDSTRAGRESKAAYALGNARYINTEWGVAVFTAKLDWAGNPYRDEWQKITAPNPGEIDGWKRGLALCALPATGSFTVLDSDPRHGDGLAVMEHELGEDFPEVFWRYSTASGGEHLWVADLGTDRKIGLLPGLDILGKDTIAFIAPTVRASKVDSKRRMYGVAEPDQAFSGESPDAAIRWIRAAIKRKQGSSAESNLPRVTDALVKRYVRGGIPDGQRDEMLTRVVFHLCQSGKTRAVALNTYRKIVAASDSKPGDRFGGVDFAAKWKSATAKLEKSNGRTIVLTAASTIDPEIVEWLWADDDWRRIPLAEVVLTAGHGGVGKSTENMWMTALVTRGELPGQFYKKPRNCLIAATEDSWKRTIVPRLIAAGADLDRVFRIEVKTDEFDGLALSLPADFALLEEAIMDKRAAVLLIDPLMRTMPADRDASKPQDARLTLEPLSGVADRTNCTIIGNCHFNKSGATDPVFRILGSIEIQNIARAIIRFASKDGTSVLSCGKNTHAPIWPSLEYAIEEAEFTQGGKTFVTSKFVLGEETDVSADDFLRAEGKKGGIGDSLKHKAEVWLAGRLGDKEVKAKDVIEEGAEEGFDERMLQRALKSIGGDSRRIGFGTNGFRVWCLIDSVKQYISSDDDDDD